MSYVHSVSMKKRQTITDSTKWKIWGYTLIAFSDFILLNHFVSVLYPLSTQSFICFHCCTDPDDKSVIIKCKESNYNNLDLRHRALHKCSGNSKHNTFRRLMTSTQCNSNKPDKELQADVDHPDAEICGIVYDPMDVKKPTINKWIDWLEDNWGTNDATDSDDESDSNSDSDSGTDSNSESGQSSDDDSDDDDGDDAQSQKEEPSDNHIDPQQVQQSKAPQTRQSPHSPLRRGRKRQRDNFINRDSGGSSSSSSDSSIVNRRNSNNSDRIHRNNQSNTNNISNVTTPNNKSASRKYRRKNQQHNRPDADGNWPTHDIDGKPYTKWCDICGKGFLTGHQLGGHRSVHSAKRKANQNMNSNSNHNSSSNSNHNNNSNSNSNSLNHLRDDDDELHSNELETVNLNVTTWPNMKQILIDQKDKLQERSDRLISDFDAKHQTMMMEMNQQRNAITKEIKRMVVEQQKEIQRMVTRFDEKFAAQNKKIDDRDLELRISKAIEQERAATQRLLDETKKQFVDFRIQPFVLSYGDAHDFSVSQCTGGTSNGVSNGHNGHRNGTRSATTLSYGDAHDFTVSHGHRNGYHHSNRNGTRSATTSPSRNSSNGLKRKRNAIDDSTDTENGEDTVLNGLHPSKRRGGGKRGKVEDEDDDLEILSNGVNGLSHSKSTNTNGVTRERSKSVPNGDNGLTLPNLSESFVAAQERNGDTDSVHSASQPQMSALRTPIKKKRVQPKRSCLSQFAEMNGTHSPSASKKKNGKQRYRSGTQMDIDHSVKRRRLNHV